MPEMCDLFAVFKNKFRKIENLTKKCVNLDGVITYIYNIYIYIYITQTIFLMLIKLNHAFDSLK